MQTPAATPRTRTVVDTTDRCSDEELQQWLAFDTFRRFYKGDGLSENLDLMLLAGGHYTLTLTGCLGLYGAAVGTWRVENRQLYLDPDEEMGTLAKLPIRKLNIRVFTSRDNRFDDTIALVEDRNLEWLNKNGVDRYGCFTPSFTGF